MLTLTQIPSQTIHELFEETNKHIPKLMHKNKVTGLSIAVIDQNQTVWSQGFGHADVENNIAANEHTIYRACSISKLFTATVIMLLVEQNKFNLNDSITQYLPELNLKNHRKNAIITVRQLLTHHSGLPSDLLRGLGQFNQPKETNLIKLINQEFQAFAPGLLHNYSNLGYNVLGCLIEKITGDSFINVMNDKLLKPLDMKNSYFASNSQGRANEAKGYSKYKERPLAHLSNIAAGGLYTTVADLAHFTQMIFNQGQFRDNKIVQSRTLKGMFKVQNKDVTLDFGFNMGLGWVLQSFQELPHYMGSVASHNGAFIHYHSQLVLLTEAKLAVAVLSNSESAANLVQKLALDMLKKSYQVKIGRSTQLKSKKYKVIKNMPINMPGHYAGIHGPSKIFTRGKSHYAKAFGKTFLLKKDNLDRWQPLPCLFGFIPVKRKSMQNLRIISQRVNGFELLLLQEPSQSFIMGVKLNEEAIDKAWLSRVGTYQVVNGKDEVFRPVSAELKVKNGFLQFSYKLGRNPKDKLVYFLKTMNSNHARIAGLGRGLGLTVSAIYHKECEYLRYSGFWFTKIS